VAARPWRRQPSRSALEGRLALLLAVDFANHRHPFFDLSQHARSEAPELCTEIGAGLVVVTILSVTLRSDMGWLLPNPVWLVRRSFADEFDGFVRFFGLSRY
jgi:hypothetical protein